MTEKLDNYAPSQEMIAGIRQQLLRAGVSYDVIPHDWMPAIIAAMGKWLTTDDGIQYVCRHFNFKSRIANSDNEYNLIDNVNRTTKFVKNTQVCILEGVLVDGQPVAIINPNTNQPIQPLELEILETTKNTCDGCGILAHCLTEIREPKTDNLVSYCNYCVYHHENLRVKDLGSLDVCVNCTVKMCPHYKETRQINTGTW